MVTQGRPQSYWLARMTTAERSGLTNPAGMLIWDTTIPALYILDGSTAGGVVAGGGSTSDFGKRTEVVTSDYTYTSGTSEQTVYEYTISDSTAHRIFGNLGFYHFTAGRIMTIKVYVKVDNSNYECIDARAYTVGTPPDNVHFDYTTYRTTKITAQVNTTEGSDKAIHRAIVNQEAEA